jgi:hypothetical protein
MPTGPDPREPNGDDPVVKRRFRPSLTLMAWLAPVLTPLAFALLLLTGLVKTAEKVGKSLAGGRMLVDPVEMFVWGWMGLTVLCAGWLAWTLCSNARGALRILAFLMVWPALTAVLGAAGIAVGIPACLPVLK